MTTVSPNQDAIDTIVRSFLQNVLPGGIEIVLGQVNRVPEPQGTDFVVFTTIDRVRLETNVDEYADVLFTGSIANGTMTVSSVAFGTIGAGAILFGSGVIVGTVITGIGSGTGGTGTYTVSPAQMTASGSIACGAKQLTANTQIIYQVDVYGPNAADNAQIVMAAWRDPYAFEFMQALNSAVAPHYADDPKQVPVIYGEEQYEDRWIVEAKLQANQTVALPQQFAGVVQVTPKEVEVVFPP